MKLPGLVSLPSGVVTLIVPSVAPAGTVAVIWVEESTVKPAAVPLKLTAVAPPKSLPLIVTVVPTGPLVGEKPVTTGGIVTLKLPGLVSVPPGVVTLMVPSVAPAGTVAVIWVEESTVKPAAVPLKLTAVAPPKSLPLIVTVVPTSPPVGEKPVTLGAGITSKLPTLVLGPSGVVTLMVPSVAPAGTVAVIWRGGIDREAGCRAVEADVGGPVEVSAVDRDRRSDRPTRRREPRHVRWNRTGERDGQQEQCRHDDRRGERRPPQREAPMPSATIVPSATATPTPTSVIRPCASASPALGPNA